MKLFKILRLLLVFLFALFVFNPAFADLSSDAKIEYNKGIQFYQTGMYSQAADCFKKATEYDPNFIDAYFNLGSLLEYLKQDDDALNAFKQIILRKPDDYEAVYKAAELSKRTGNVEKAIMYLSLIPEDSLIGQRAKELAQLEENFNFEKEQIKIKYQMDYDLIKNREENEIKKVLEKKIIEKARNKLLKLINYN